MWKASLLCRRDGGRRNRRLNRSEWGVALCSAGLGEGEEGERGRQRFCLGFKYAQSPRNVDMASNGIAKKKNVAWRRRGGKPPAPWGTSNG